MAAQDSNAKSNAEYVNQLLKEQEGIHSPYSHAYKLIQQEIERVRSIENGGDSMRKDNHIEIHSGKQFRLKTKVHIPVDEFPNVNFVGKLLGPKGSSLQQLQEATQTKMAILGRGSMRDKKKEEELRNGSDPKYSHLNEDLHIEITAYASPPEAYRRMSGAVAEVSRFLVPEYFDDMRAPAYDKPKQPYGNEGPPMASRGGPSPGGRGGPMGPPMMGGGREPPRRPALAQSTYAAGEGEDWSSPRQGAPRRGAYNAAAPTPRPARPYEDSANDYNNYGDSYGDYNSGTASSYYDYGEAETGYADGYSDDSRGPPRGAGGRGRSAARVQSHPYAGASRRGY